MNVPVLNLEIASAKASGADCACLGMHSTESVLEEERVEGHLGCTIYWLEIGGMVSLDLMKERECYLLGYE